MITLLHIETSTNVCSLALSQNGKILWNKENREGQSHSILLGKYLEEVLNFTRTSKIQIDGIAISCGPGSYTGLRIGVSTSKGLAYGLNIPLIAVNTLQLMANRIIKTQKTASDSWLCPMIDARRMEVYTAFFDKNLNFARQIQADIIDEHSYSEILKERKIICFGNGADKCKNILKHPNVEFIDDIYPSATDMIELAEKAYINKNFQDVAYFEPFYLKEFIATTPKNKVINPENKQE